MFARTQPSSHAGSEKGRKQKQGKRTERVDPGGGGGGEGEHNPPHSLSLVDDMEGASELTSHASLDTTAGHMTSHDAI